MRACQGHVCVCVCVCVCVYVCCVCMCICVYVCMYVYVYTYCVLIKPPMPYITSSPVRCVCFVFLRPKNLTSRLKTFIYYILAAVFASCFYVLFKFRFVREGTHGSPLVNPLNKVFLKFMMQITS